MNAQNPSSPPPSPTSRKNTTLIITSLPPTPSKTRGRALSHSLIGHSPPPTVSQCHSYAQRALGGPGPPHAVPRVRSRGKWRSGAAWAVASSPPTPSGSSKTASLGHPGGVWVVVCRECWVAWRNRRKPQLGVCRRRKGINRSSSRTAHPHLSPLALRRSCSSTPCPSCMFRALALAHVYIHGTLCSVLMWLSSLARCPHRATYSSHS